MSIMHGPCLTPALAPKRLLLKGQHISLSRSLSLSLPLSLSLSLSLSLILFVLSYFSFSPSVSFLSPSCLSIHRHIATFPALSNKTGRNCTKINPRLEHVQCAALCHPLPQERDSRVCLCPEPLTCFSFRVALN